MKIVAPRTPFNRHSSLDLATITVRPFRALLPSGSYGGHFETKTIKSFSFTLTVSQFDRIVLLRRFRRGKTIQERGGIRQNLVQPIEIR